MIQVKQQRSIHGCEQQTLCAHVSVTAALFNFARNIFNGGCITQYAEDMAGIEVEVRVHSGIVDRYVYTGDEAAMQPLTHLMLAATVVRVIHKASQPERGAAFFDGTAFRQAAMAGAFVGLGIEDDAVLERIRALRLEDQCAMFVLMHENPEAPIGDLIALAA